MKKTIIFDERSPRWENNGLINGLTLAKRYATNEQVFIITRCI